MADALTLAEERYNAIRLSARNVGRRKVQQESFEKEKDAMELLRLLNLHGRFRAHPVCNGWPGAEGLFTLYYYKC